MNTTRLIPDNYKTWGMWYSELGAVTLAENVLIRTILFTFCDSVCLQWKHERFPGLDSLFFLIGTQVLTYIWPELRRLEWCRILRCSTSNTVSHRHIEHRITVDNACTLHILEHPCHLIVCLTLTYTFFCYFIAAQKFMLSYQKFDR